MAKLGTKVTTDWVPGIDDPRAHPLFLLAPPTTPVLYSGHSWVHAITGPVPVSVFLGFERQNMGSRSDLDGWLDWTGWRLVDRNKVVKVHNLCIYQRNPISSRADFRRIDWLCTHWVHSTPHHHHNHKYLKCCISCTYSNDRWSGNLQMIWFWFW